MRLATLHDQGERVWHRAPLTAKSDIARMELAFNGQLRLRWSVREGCWHVEQQAPPGLISLEHARLKRLPMDQWIDERVRARDGYTLVMRVAASAAGVPCEHCGELIPVKPLETTECTCAPCNARGVKSWLPIGYWPVDGYTLVNYLKSCTPEHSGQRIKQRDADQRLTALRREGAASRERQAGMRDALLDQLPKAGHPSLVLDSWRH